MLDGMVGVGGGGMASNRIRTSISVALNSIAILHDVHNIIYSTCTSSSLDHVLPYFRYERIALCIQ